MNIKLPWYAKVASWFISIDDIIAWGWNVLCTWLNAYLAAKNPEKLKQFMSWLERIIVYCQSWVRAISDGRLDETEQLDLQTQGFQMVTDIRAEIKATKAEEAKDGSQ